VRRSLRHDKGGRQAARHRFGDPQNMVPAGFRVSGFAVFVGLSVAAEIQRRELGSGRSPL